VSKLKKDDFDSWDEYHFYLWILDAKELGLVTQAKFYPKAFELSELVEYNKEVQMKTKTKIVKKKLLAPHVYTADTLIEFVPMFHDLFPEMDIHPDPTYPNSYWFDVKPSVNQKYVKYGSSKTFPLNQKWVYQVHGIYINRIMMKVLFHKTWCPHEVRQGARVPVLKPWIGTKTKEDIKDLIFEKRTMFE